MDLKKALKLWLEHVGRFGPIDGTNIVRLKSQRSSSLASVQLPDGGRSILLRPGTSDMAIYDEVFLSKFLPLDTPYKTVIDCGANIGCTVLFWKTLDPACKVIAIEPDPANFAILMKNTEGLEDVHCIQAGVWPTKGKLDLDMELGGHSAVRTTASENSEGVEAVTIPDLMRSHHMDRVSLMKVDIEGSELELFSQGDLSWIERVDAFAIELHDHWRPGCGDAFMKAIAPFDWTWSIYGYTLVCHRWIK